MIYKKNLPALIAATLLFLVGINALKTKRITFLQNAVGSVKETHSGKKAVRWGTVFIALGFLALSAFLFS